MIYDRTCGALTASWKAGAVLYRALGRLDASYGAASWSEALEWLANHAPDRRIQEIQFWGHGNWGCAKIDGERLDAGALEPSDPRHALLSRIRERLVDGGAALWWFRTCETFGTEAGHAFARAWSRFFRCRVAGHTYIIWLAQSGLHAIDPDREPSWPIDEGTRAAKDGRTAPKARWSLWHHPNTISCFTGEIPASFEARAAADVRSAAHCGAAPASLLASEARSGEAAES
jgi:hypothetical protein